MCSTNGIDMIANHNQTQKIWTNKILTVFDIISPLVFIRNTLYIFDEDINRSVLVGSIETGGKGTKAIIITAERYWVETEENGLSRVSLPVDISSHYYLH